MSVKIHKQESFMDNSFAYEGSLTKNQCRLISYCVQNYNIGWDPSLCKEDLKSCYRSSLESLIRKNIFVETGTYFGKISYTLNIGDKVFPCYILDDSYLSDKAQELKERNQKQYDFLQISQAVHNAAWHDSWHCNCDI